MVRTSKKTEDTGQKKRKAFLEDLDDSTKRVVCGIALSVVSLFLVLAALGMAGVVGDQFFKFVTFLLGIGYILLPILSITLSLVLLTSYQREFPAIKIVASVLFLISGLGFIDLAFQKAGIVGHFITLPLIRFFDFYVSFAVLSALLLISVLVLYNARIVFSPAAFLRKLFERQPAIRDTTSESAPKNNNELSALTAEKRDTEPTLTSEEKPKNFSPDLQISNNTTFEKGRARPAPAIPVWSGTYIPPPLELLKGDRGKPSVGDVKANANIIKRTLQNFGIVVEMSEVSIGPSFTRYALKPA